MNPRPRPLLARTRLILALGLTALLAACGGGGTALTCDAADQKTWLRSFMGEWYFWYRLSPSPDPAGYATLADYFDALLYKGGTPPFPSDRYSGFESTESFNRFYGDGQTLGYGMFVAGVEVRGLPGDPLYVRYIEPRSDAAARGVRRGDRVLSVNGRSASDLIAADDFSVLSPANPGDLLTLELDGATGRRTVTLTAAVYALTPVPTHAVVTTPLGRRMGYVVVKDMISQANSPMETAFADFRRQGVAEAVIDLRYNGGGLVSVASLLGAYVGGVRTAGQTFAQLLYNDQRSAINNQTFTFQNPSSALGLAKVYVLAGPRTCSASEQIVNGLRPFTNVVVIGDTTCGKPVGSLPRSNCGQTFSAINFESVNARTEGRYFDGFEPTCRVAEDFTRALGTSTEPLLQAAMQHADSGACPLPTAAERERPMRRLTPAERVAEPGERQGMLAR